MENLRIMLFGVLLILIGGVNAVFPALAAEWKSFWQGWKYKDASPSDTMILVTRIGGIVVLLVGVALIVFSSTGT